jgi:3-dehydroquinate synthase
VNWRGRADVLLEETIHVQAGGRARGYPIKVRNGIRRSLPQMIPAHTKAHRYAVIADERVADLYGQEVVRGLVEAGREASLLTFPPGEASKTREEWARLTDAMLEEEFGRDSAVVAVGGGVAGDLAGFVAATFMRGVPLVQVPTSLVAMIDSSVGGKAAVDVPEGKNLVGAFHSPRLVVVDPEVAVTLPREERAQGLAEAVKHGAILDPVYLADLEGDIPCVMNGEVGATGRVVVRSIEIKADVVSKDERESGLRKILNFGHTIGHAVESAASYSLPHGSCVGLGMVLEARLGEALGVTRAGTSEVLERLVSLLELPTRLPESMDPEAVLGFTRTDKKGRGGRPRYVLLAQAGQVAPGADWAQEVPDDLVLSILEGGGG